MNENICHFIPFHKDHHSIHTINFVLETKLQIYNSLKSQAVYKIHFVRTGKGKLHVAGRIIPLEPGDVFFTFPGVPFCIESVESFTYMYITFLGSRANMIMDKLEISPQNFHFKECHEICDFCEKGLDSLPETTEWISESVLLYSFHYLGNNIVSVFSAKKNTKKEAPFEIKKYIDDNISQTKLSLEVLSQEFSYSPKYISTIFKKHFNVGITEYLNTARIQLACTLMQQGFTSISDIALQCGYADPLYFSKGFRQKMGISPKSHMKKYTNDPQ